jgi:hypothetical protein
MSHELIGLSAEELETWYYAADPELRPVLDVLKGGNGGPVKSARLTSQGLPANDLRP